MFGLQYVLEIISMDFNGGRPARGRVRCAVRFGEDAGEGKEAWKGCEKGEGTGEKGGKGGGGEHGDFRLLCSTKAQPSKTGGEIRAHNHNSKKLEAY